MTNDRLIHAYHAAMGDYAAAKAGTTSRVELFTSLLMAETVLTTRLGRIDQNLEHFRKCYSP
jgi:hypothetical protein